MSGYLKSTASDPEPPTAGRWDTHWLAFLAWLVIAGLVTFIAYQNAHRNAVRKDGALGDAGGKLLGQVAIQLKSFNVQTNRPLSARVSENIESLIRDMEKEAHTPEGALRVAIIAGEAQGKDQALAKLDTLAGAQTSSELAEDIAALRAIYMNGADALNSTAQDRLIQRHDFFARVALIYGVAANAEPRKSIEESVKRTVIRISLVGLGLLLLMTASIGLFIAAVMLQVKGRLRRAYVPDPSANTAFLESFALYLVLFFGVSWLVRRQFGLVSLSWEWLALLIIPIIVLWAAFRGANAAGRQKALGWHCGRGWLREIAAGLAGYLAGMVLVALGIFGTFVLVRRTGALPVNPILQMLQGNAWQVLELYAVACVFAPVMEETMFRGALFHHLRRRWGWWITAPTVAFIFAVIHPQGWIAVPALGSIAIVLAALREWRGSIIAPMAAHAFNNFIVLTLALSLLR